MRAYSLSTRRLSLNARQRLRLAASGALLATLSGCFYANTSQAPIATTYPYTEQQRMQAAHHWNVLAEHQATRIIQNGRTRFRDLYITPLPDRDTAHGGEFGRGFRDFLTSQLVSRGVNVVNTPREGSAQVHVNVEVVEHQDRQAIRPPHGALTALASGIAVATYPINHWKEPILGLLPLAAGADVASGSWTHEGNEEIIITTQIIDDERILYSSSNVYYTNRGDRRHYAPDQVPQAPSAPTISVTDTW